jgi:PPOX class probable F420-dependent enzyme
MTTLDEAFELARAEHGLAVVSTARADASIQSTLINAGIVTHPGTGMSVLGIVTAGRVKLANLRQRPQITVTFRSGWHFGTVEGVAELVGPDDSRPWLDAEGLRLLLREIFTAAGGSHDDWAEYDRVMVAERRAAVLVRPSRVYGQ